MVVTGCARSGSAQNSMVLSGVSALFPASCQQLKQWTSWHCPHDATFSIVSPDLVLALSGCWRAAHTSLQGFFLFSWHTAWPCLVLCAVVLALSWM
jgi:hypothetical protein